MNRAEPIGQMTLVTHLIIDYVNSAISEEIRMMPDLLDLEVGYTDTLEFMRDNRTIETLEVTLGPGGADLTPLSTAPNLVTVKISNSPDIWWADKVKFDGMLEAKFKKLDLSDFVGLTKEQIEVVSRMKGLVNVVLPADVNVKVVSLIQKSLPNCTVITANKL